MKWYYWAALGFVILVVYMRSNPFPGTGTLAEKDAWRASPAGRLNAWIGEHS